MAIKYFPNRIQTIDPSIDRVMVKRKPHLIRGSQDITATPVDTVISADTDWHLNNIKFTFSGAIARDYFAKILGGRKVVSDLNDSLWIQHDATLPQNIVLDSNFYTGTELASELQSKLDANTAFSNLGVTFIVSYDPITGFFTITPSSGTIRYLNVNFMTTPRYQDSIAGHLLGLTADTSFGASVVSNESVFGLNAEAWIVDETGSVVTEDFFDDLKVLDVDQALHIYTGTAGVIMDWEVNYEEIV